MLLLLGARGVVVATFTSHVLLFIRDRVFVWLLVCCCCLVEQFIEFGLHPQELHLSRSTRSEFLHGWCQKWDYNLVEAHCYGIRKGSGHVLSNHVAVNG